MQADELPVLISNLEVAELLQNRIDQRSGKKRSRQTRHRDWIEAKVLEYLKQTPCTKLDPSKREEFMSVLQTNKKVASKNGQAAATGFDLTEAESLQIVNFMPTEPVEIHLMIEELHARMTETKQDQLLGVIASYAKKEPPDRKDGDGDAMDEENHSGMNGGMAVKLEAEDEEDGDKKMAAKTNGGNGVVVKAEPDAHENGS